MTVRHAPRWGALPILMTLVAACAAGPEQAEPAAPAPDSSASEAHESSIPTDSGTTPSPETPETLDPSTGPSEATPELPTQGTPVGDAPWDDPFEPAPDAELVASGASVQQMGEEAFISYRGTENGLRLTLRDAYFDGEGCTHMAKLPSERGTYLFLDVEVSLSEDLPEETIWFFDPTRWRASVERDDQLDPTPWEWTEGTMYCIPREESAVTALVPGMSTEGLYALDVTGMEGWVTYAPDNGPLWTWKIPEV
ncbi:hypothetical protein [Litorihabitans aurantiacus]|uniref:DUF4352 domain-containing protein n=1 Tax=Litorihabitans aurantiacus TaxID=1930061 RepID=A0AA37XE74_9MICO|nr:hypothetical protein [Litorihabitans aurantiacus]GMA31561.1 hypothetical protein GCM10025875_15530 [Litorihabitans aurantiacus]